MSPEETKPQIWAKVGGRKAGLTLYFMVLLAIIIFWVLGLISMAIWRRPAWDYLPLLNWVSAFAKTALFVFVAFIGGNAWEHWTQCKKNSD